MQHRQGAAAKRVHAYLVPLAAFAEHHLRDLPLSGPVQNYPLFNTISVAFHWQQLHTTTSE